MKTKITVLLWLGCVVGSFLFAADTYALFGFPGGKYSQVKAENGLVTIPLDQVNDGKAHYFSHDVQGKTIKFFVIRSNDGVIRAAFDACDVCFPEKKGYSQDGDFMICINCGQRFHTSRINVVKGGCNPAPLHRVSQGRNLVIAAADILTGSRYF
ncbi:MAG: Fe-S-containing protein [Desulfobulbaceae bacterium]